MNDLITFALSSENTTKMFAKNLAKELKFPLILFLTGDLGTGKTFFTKMFLSNFINLSNYQSPTFTLYKEYFTKNKKIIHLDCYKLTFPLTSSEHELIQDLFLDDYFLLIVEWADMLPKSFFQNHVHFLKLMFIYTNDYYKRLLKCEYHCSDLQIRKRFMIFLNQWNSKHEV